MHVSLRHTACAPDVALRRVMLRGVLPLVGDEAKWTWIHCAVEGTWEGHPDGAFTFDRDTFERIVANFERRGQPVPLTYEHPRYAGDGQPVLAAGWVHELRVAEDGLYAHVELTDATADMVKRGQYKFSSVVVDFASVDTVSGDEIGPELLELAVTNQPFLTGLAPIQLSRRAVANTRTSMALDPAKAMAAVAKALGLEDGAKEEQMTAALAAMAQLRAAMSGKADKKEESASDDKAPEMAAPVTEPPTADAALSDAPADATKLADDAPKAEGDAGSPVSPLADLAKALGMDEAALGSWLAANVDKLKALMAEGEAAPEGGGETDAEFFGMSAKLDEYRDKSVRLSKQVEERDVEVQSLKARVAELEHGAVVSRIDEAIKRGEVGQADRERLVKLARIAGRDKEAAELLDSYLSEAAKAPEVPTGKRVLAKPTQGVGEDDGADIDPEMLAAYETQLRGLYKDAKKRRAAAIKNCRAALSKSAPA